MNEQQCGEFAAQLFEATCDGLGVATKGIVLHSDNGKPMKGSSMLSTMQIGIVVADRHPRGSPRGLKARQPRQPRALDW